MWTSVATQAEAQLYRVVKRGRRSVEKVVDHKTLARRFAAAEAHAGEFAGTENALAVLNRVWAD